MKIAFLHSDLEECIYMAKPKGLKNLERRNMFLFLRSPCMDLSSSQGNSTRNLVNLC